MPKILFSLIFLFNLLFANRLLAKPLIVTSTTPIASLLDLLTSDIIDIDAIATSSLCPHSFQAKPSDLKKTMTNDIVVFIHKDFDSFAAKLMSKSPNIVQLSNCKNLKLLKEGNNINWHFWLDLYNAKILLTSLSDILINKFPEFESEVRGNLAKSYELISYLESKQKQIAIKDILIVDESLEYFFLPFGDKVHKLFRPTLKSVKYNKDMKELIDRYDIKCIIISHEQTLAHFEHFKLSVIQFDSENWAKNNSINGFKDLFQNQYLNFLKQLKPCME